MTKMSLLDDLKTKRETAKTQIDNARWRISCEEDEIARLNLELADLDKAISALTPEDGNDALLADQQDTPPQSNAQASVTDAEGEDPTAVAIAAYIEAENADTPTDAERTSVVTDHDRVDQTNTDTVAAVEIPEGFIPWSGGECPVDPVARVDVIRRDGKTDDPLDFNRSAGSLPWSHLQDESDIIAYKVISEPAEASEERSQADVIKAIATETCIACGREINLAVSDEERDTDVGLGEDGWQCGDCTRKYIGGASADPPSELDSQAQPQTKSEQSDNPPEEKFSAEKHGGEAGFWTKALEQDRKPQPGFIEGAVSKLFGIKEPA